VQKARRSAGQSGGKDIDRAVNDPFVDFFSNKNLPEHDGLLLLDSQRVRASGQR
jgi:hypothetical protein